MHDDVGEFGGLESGAESGAFSLIDVVGDEADALFFCFSTLVESFGLTYFEAKLGTVAMA
ncbi:hypothetical protein N9973_01895 [bacterium]|nr:hypothetical protein [bacterium]